MRSLEQRPVGQPIKNVVLAGGGHSHAVVARILSAYPLAGVRICLISDVAYAPYSGMLPGLIAGFYTYEDAHIDLRQLCEGAGIEFIEDRVVGVDPVGRRVLCASHPPLAYDVLSLNLGSMPHCASVPGVNAYATPAKPVSKLLAAWQEILTAAYSHDTSPPQRIVIVGAGAGGLELAFNMQARLRTRATLTIIDRAKDVLSGQRQGAAKRLRYLLRKRGIALCLGSGASRVDATAVHLSNGQLIAYDRLIWVTSASAPAWLQSSGLKLSSDGFIEISATLQSTSHREVFAAGDVATLTSDPHPKSGVFAVRQGKILAANLLATIEGKPLQVYRPQKRFLSLIGAGDGRAVAMWGPFSLEGAWFWKLKDWIDRRFMHGFAVRSRPHELGRQAAYGARLYAKALMLKGRKALHRFKGLISR